MTHSSKAGITVKPLRWILVQEVRHKTRATVARGQRVIPHGKQNVPDVTLCSTKGHAIIHQSPKKHTERKIVGARIVPASGEHLGSHVCRSFARLGEQLLVFDVLRTTKVQQHNPGTVQSFRDLGVLGI